MPIVAREIGGASSHSGGRRSVASPGTADEADGDGAPPEEEEGGFVDEVDPERAESLPLSSSRPTDPDDDGDDGGGDDDDDDAAVGYLERSRESGASAAGGLTNRRRVIAADGSRQLRHPVPDRWAPRPGRAGGSDGGGGAGGDRSAHHRGWGSRTAEYYRGQCCDRTFVEWAAALLPALRWLRTYGVKRDLSKDVLAGLTVGIMVVPQSMSYAKLAGLPVEYGLYSAFCPVFAYAFFGSSRQLAVGPVALISLMLSTGLTHIIDPTGELSSHTDSHGKNGIESNPELQGRYNTLAIQAAFLVGIIYIGMGLLRLGFVTIFLSHAVISGFTTGAAVIIGCSQLKYILGYDVERSDVLHEILHNIFAHIDQFNWRTFVMGTLSVLALVLMKNIGKKYPRLKWVRAAGPLTVTAFTILITWTAHLDQKGIPVVEFIPQGFPSFTASVWTPIPEIAKLIRTVGTIVVVGFMESIAIAKQLASKHNYELDSSLELIGLGVSNFFGAMFQSYPVTGSFSRSAVNNESGAVSGVSGVVTGALVGFTLLVLTPVFEMLPLCVLAAIVISGVLGLLDYAEAIYLWAVHRFDFAVWVIACLGTMFLGVEIGLGIAVALSILIVIYESAYPHTAVLGRLPGTTVYRNVKQYPSAERYDGVVVVRVDAPIYFANTQNVQEKLVKYERRAAEEMDEGTVLRRHRAGVGYKPRGSEGSAAPLDVDGRERVRFVVLEMSPVSHVDSTGLHMLHELRGDYEARGIGLCLSNPNGHVMERLSATGLVEEIGRDRIFVTAHDAVDWCLRQIDDAEDTENIDDSRGTGPGTDSS